MKLAWRRCLLRISLVAGVVFLCALLSSQPAPRDRVGPLPDGGFLLNSFWRLAPVGRQIPLDTLPMSTALSPDGRYLLALNCGYKPPSITVIDSATGNVVDTVPVPDAWLGLTFSPKGDRVYVGGGSQAALFEFAFADGKLTAARTFEVTPKDKHAADDFVGDVTFSPDGHLLYAAELYKNDIVVVNPQSGMVIDRFKTGRRPYRIVFHPDGQTYFVSSWADGSVSHYETANGNLLVRVPVAAHPTDMIWRDGAPADTAPGEPTWTARLFVAAANTNNVYSIAVTSGKQVRVVESINMAMSPRQPLGMTPSGLGLSPDGKRLFVACSDANVAGVVDVSEDRSRVEGFIPAGWYPTAVRMLPSGTLVIVNGKGTRSYPNPNGPSPMSRPQGMKHEGSVGRLQTGTASWIAPFTTEQLADWTQQARANSPYRDAKLDEPNPLPPIQHIIYIVKENRTYDQMLGDIKEGNGDPSLVLFGETITPNLHKLAREFVLLDNFYVSADVSADGHNWSTAAISPDYVNKLWPSNYASRRKTYDFEEQDPSSLPPAGYLWSNASMAGLSIRNFGYMVENKKQIAPTGSDQIEKIDDPVLAKVTNRNYRTFDLKYLDVDRAKVFLSEFVDYEKTGQMPRLIVMRLGNDHTEGTKPGALTPQSHAADNDLAVGTIVEAVSKSPFWSSTLICILEDDAQNGPDHVDSHRSPAYLISPYIKRRSVDSHMYNTTSMLRTMETLLGLRPMTHFDASAPLMTAAFQSQPDPTPYAAEKARVSLADRNPPNAPGAKDMEGMNFDKEDEIDEDVLNNALWRAVRKDAPPPPPVRSYFGK
jgi:DNA-binding beta-propeller fold protein YncE